ncbi:hypothetical protein [Runella zeae]|uniref:hypothetical protein n=1 Tax=Runella zeae TaxID=94255 RepID=UPI001B7FA35E|nr:hypothetical protein [Runella zeae]
MQNEFARGMELGRKHLSAIMKRGAKWQNRHIPIYIRENLMYPFFITEVGTEEYLYVIQAPLNDTEKVHFLQFARRPRDESHPQISGNTQ